MDKKELGVYFRPSRGNFLLNRFMRDQLTSVPASPLISDEDLAKTRANTRGNKTGSKAKNLSKSTTKSLEKSSRKRKSTQPTIDEILQETLIKSKEVSSVRRSWKKVFRRESDMSDDLFDASGSNDGQDFDEKTTEISRNESRDVDEKSHGIRANTGKKVDVRKLARTSILSRSNAKQDTSESNLQPGPSNRSKNSPVNNKTVHTSYLGSGSSKKAVKRPSRRTDADEQSPHKQEDVLDAQKGHRVSPSNERRRSQRLLSKSPSQKRSRLSMNKRQVEDSVRNEASQVGQDQEDKDVEEILRTSSYETQKTFIPKNPILESTRLSYVPNDKKQDLNLTESFTQTTRTEQRQNFIKPDLSVVEEAEYFSNYSREVSESAGNNHENLDLTRIKSESVKHETVHNNSTQQDSVFIRNSTVVENISKSEIVQDDKSQIDASKVRSRVPMVSLKRDNPPPNFVVQRANKELSGKAKSILDKYFPIKEEKYVKKVPEKRFCEELKEGESYGLPPLYPLPKNSLKRLQKLALYVNVWNSDLK